MEWYTTLTELKSLNKRQCSYHKNKKPSKRQEISVFADTIWNLLRLNHSEAETRRSLELEDNLHSKVQTRNEKLIHSFPKALNLVPNFIPILTSWKKIKGKC